MGPLVLWQRLRAWCVRQHNSDSASAFYIVFCFCGHGSASVLLIILNKSIAVHFPYAFTLVAIQNCGTIFGTLFVHFLGIMPLRLVKREYYWRLILNGIWLILVLFSSMKSLGLISVPLYVVGRNTVPFQTAALDYLFLNKQMTAQSALALCLTLMGTLVYTYADFTIDATGLVYAALNTALVAGICVYESATMRLVKASLSPMELNFYRVVFGLPFLVPLTYCEWQSYGVGPSQIIVDLQPVGLLVFISSVFAWSIGSFLFALQAVTSATTIQLVNVGYKFLTTFVSRFTHPAPVHMAGWLGYLICSLGIMKYILKPVQEIEGHLTGVKVAPRKISMTTVIAPHSGSWSSTEQKSASSQHGGMDTRKED